MSLAADIIGRAYREGQIVALVATPSDLEQAEALSLLNILILSVLGNEIGQELHDLNVGGAYDQSQFLSCGVPQNTRLILNLGSGKTLKLDPRPYDGQRLGIADVANNLSTYNLLLDGNGRNIEGSSSLTLSASGIMRQWLFRSDTGNWAVVTDLALTDTMPFPEEYDDYFTIRLAMRLFPRNGIGTTQETVQALQRSERQLKARYRRPRPPQELGTLGLIGQRRTSFNEGWLLK